MEVFNNIVTAADDKVWFLLLFLLVGTGIYFSIRTRFVQIRHFPQAWKRVFGNFSLHGSKAGKEGMSSFQALATAIAAQVGTGNIAGCATAILGGGPGAIFWMWVAAFFGMATIYGEACLAQKTKTRDDKGHVIGGPVYYMRAAFKGDFGKFLAGFFAVAITLALGIMGNMVQSNSITDAFHNIIPESVNIPQVAGIPVDKLCLGVLVAAVAGFIFIGGIGRIAAFTEKVVPMMAGLYLLGGLILLVINCKNLPAAVASIFVGAFNPQAVCGAGAGIAVRQALRLGVARGLFSNEAGMGSTPHAHAMAKVEKPQDQGEVAMVGVFIDTFVVLTMTALVILSSNVLGNIDLFCTKTAGMKWNPSGIGTGTPVAQAAFSAGFGKFGPVFVAICLLFFAFSTIIGWYFFAQQNIKYLLGAESSKIFSVVVIIFIFIGALLKVDLVWNLSDLFNGIMVLPNLIALIALSGAVAKLSHGQDVDL